MRLQNLPHHSPSSLVVSSRIFQHTHHHHSSSGKKACLEQHRISAGLGPLLEHMNGCVRETTLTSQNHDIFRSFCQGNNLLRRSLCLDAYRLSRSFESRSNGDGTCNGKLLTLVIYVCIHIYFSFQSQNQKQMDPTDIVKVPIDLPRLFLHVSVVLFVATLLTQHNNNILTKLWELTKLTFIVFVTMIVCGASPYQDQWHTMMAAVYLTTLLTWDPPIFNESHDKTKPQSLRIRVLRGGSSLCSLQDRVAVAVSHCTLATTIPLQILRLYDRGWQIQRWPVPVILGSTYGWILGVLVGTLWAVRASSSSLSQDSSSPFRRPKE